MSVPFMKTSNYAIMTNLFTKNWINRIVGVEAVFLFKNLVFPLLFTEFFLIEGSNIYRNIKST